MPDERCPRCFSEINITAPEWTDDPIQTPKGEAGDDYKGFTYINPIHIKELQEIRTQQEDDLGFLSEDDSGYVEGGANSKTIFTEINTEINIVDVYKKHILELRESTEKILTTTGQTKDNYFNYDEDGKEYNIESHQTDWKDPNLAIKPFANIKAYHIEDLRHYLLIDITDPTKCYLLLKQVLTSEEEGGLGTWVETPVEYTVNFPPFWNIGSDVGYHEPEFTGDPEYWYWGSHGWTVDQWRQTGHIHGWWTRRYILNPDVINLYPENNYYLTDSSPNTSQPGFVCSMLGTEYDNDWEHDEHRYKAYWHDYFNIYMRNYNHYPTSFDDGIVYQKDYFPEVPGFWQSWFRSGELVYEIGWTENWENSYSEWDVWGYALLKSIVD